MWPFKPRTDLKEGTVGKVTLCSNDDLHTRIFKALKYSGSVNPNSFGTVDSVVFILGEYERMDAEFAASKHQTEDK